MNAASAVAPAASPVTAIPVELARLFEASAIAHATYARMAERDRRGFINYIELGPTPSARERRAAIVATSLVGLASVIRVRS
jgi:hypothetical protein